MAALIVEQARAVRGESRRIRTDSKALRFAVHASVLTALDRNDRAVAAVRRRTRLSLTAASPWSSLPWRYDDGTLHAVLVPLG
jgi:hypothetical protein